MVKGKQTFGLVSSCSLICTVIDCLHLIVKEMHSKSRAFYVKAFEKILHYLSFHTQVLEDLMFPDAKLRKNVEVVDAIEGSKRGAYCHLWIRA